MIIGVVTKYRLITRALQLELRSGLPVHIASQPLDFIRLETRADVQLCDIALVYGDADYQWMEAACEQYHRPIMFYAPAPKPPTREELREMEQDLFLPEAFKGLHNALRKVPELKR